MAATDQDDHQQFHGDEAGYVQVWDAEKGKFVFMKDIKEMPPVVTMDEPRRERDAAFADDEETEEDRAFYAQAAADDAQKLAAKTRASSS